MNIQDISNKLKKDLIKLDFKDIILQGYMMGWKSSENEDELFNKYLIGYNLICTTFSSFGLYALSDQDFYNILNELLGPYNDITTQTYNLLLIKRDQHLNNCKESEEYYEKYLKDFFERMKKRPVLIRFIDKLDKRADILQCIESPYYLLNAKTLNKYFELIDIDLFRLNTDDLYGNTMFTIIKSFNCTSYKVIVQAHGVKDKDIGFMLSVTNTEGNVERIRPNSFIGFLIGLSKPIELLNFACYAGFSKYINELPEESLIIDVGNCQLVFGHYLLHHAYAEKEFQDYFFGNGIDFFKVLALYCLFNNYLTNDKPAISSKNSNINLDVEIKRLQETTTRDKLLKDLVTNEFIKQLARYGIISKPLLNMMYDITFNKTNYSFSYTLAQFLLDMKEVDFPNNIVNKSSKYYHQLQRKLKLFNIDKKLLDDFLGDPDIFYINPFLLLCNRFEFRVQIIPYYSYQKFITILVKYIK
jgi:hypothetical protein